MKKITRWSPDTCNCVLEYEWDTDVPQDERVHTIANIVKACPAHAGDTDKASHFGKVKDENQRKNKVRQDILDTLSSVRDTITNDDGSTTYEFKRGISFTWQFNDQRVLEVSVTGLTTQQKSTLQSLADSRYGTGKVILL